MTFIPVILSGGTGSRLWPMSREAYPKQLLRLTGEDSLIQQTVKRIRELYEASAPILVCNNEHRFLVAEQMLEIGVKPLEIILEPLGRNTAPAIAVAALRALKEHDNPNLLILPADHLLGNIERFQHAIKVAEGLSDKGFLVTFGIKPTSPETGYGYIKRGEALGDGAYRVERFVEKPDEERAKRYLDEGSFSWNSGMFFFRAKDYLSELKAFEPKMYDMCKRAFSGAAKDLDFLRLEKKSFSLCPSNSIDYAVMERTEKCAVIPLDCPWNDIGSWASLWEVNEKDEDGNVSRGDVITKDVKDSILFSEKRLVAALGLSEVIVIDTTDALLVADKKRSQEIKDIVSRLKEKGREELIFHSKVYRPWGSYEGLVSGDRFQVKLITVKPGAKLSVQMHHHRAEHWIIVKGTARVQRGDETILLTENQSTFIPLGTIHSLENPGKIPLELIEVQSGPYLGEDDIVRFEDRYGRAKQTKGPQ